MSVGPDREPARMATNMPADVAANIDHIDRLDRKLARIQDHRRDALAAMVQAVRRHPWPLEDAMCLLEYLRAAGVEAGLAIEAAGYRMQKLHHFHKRVARRDGDDERRWAPDDGTPTVYLLLLDGVVVYIGCTEHPIARVAAHRQDGRVFDDAHYFTQPTLHDARDLEAVLINQHRPAGNKRIEKRSP